MKKIITFLLLIGSIISCLAQSKSIYTNPDFNELAKGHKVLAIVPFKANIELRPRQRKKMTDKEFKELQISEGLAVQNGIESYFLKKKSTKEFTVDFQEVNKTNALLKKNNITIDDLDAYTTKEVAELLGVDGIISGTLKTSKPMSDGASLALGLVVGFYGSTNSGTCTINIHDGETEKLLWKYSKTLSRSLGSDTNTVIAAMMRKSSRKFPYIDLLN